MQEINWIDLEGVNAYLVKNQDKFMLVDTGGHMFMDKKYDDRREMLNQQLQQYGVNDHNLALILLTHGDNDHVCNARYIRDTYHSKIAMNIKDTWMVQKTQPDCYKVNAKYKSIILKLIFKIMDSKIRKLEEKVYSEFECFTPDILLKDGDDLSTYGFDGKVYSVPGHTEGSICLLDTKGNLIVGDMFANNKKPALAINAQSFSELTRSAKKILSHDIKKIYPGHGKPFEQPFRLV